LIDLKHTRLKVKCKIKKGDNTNIDATENVGPVNNFLHSLWSQVEIYFNNVLVSTTSPHYGYKAYIKHLMYRGTVEDKTVGFMKDTEDEMDDVDVRAGSNLNLLERAKWLEGSKEFCMEGPLWEGVMEMDKYLLNGGDIQLRLHKNQDKFILLSSENSATYNVTDVTLQICKAVVNEGLMETFTQTLTRQPSLYCYDTWELTL